VSVISN